MFINILIILVFLALLLYTAIVVFEEAAAYRAHARPLFFAHFCFALPSWWRECSRGEGFVIFERNDISLDWSVKFEAIPYDPLPLEEIMAKLVGKRRIVFDMDAGAILTTEDFQGRAEVQNGDLEIVRIEGTATESEEGRIYYDIFLFKDNKNRQLLVCESKSSVLNGMVEGPYFEEAVLNYRYLGAIPTCAS